MVGNKKLNILIVLLIGFVMVLMVQRFTHFGMFQLKMPQIKPLITSKSVNTITTKLAPTPKPSIVTTTTFKPWHPQATVNPLRTKAEILRWNKGWEEWENFCSNSSSLDKANLTSPAGRVEMFIHPIENDKWVSGAIKSQGSWEPGILKLIHYFMSRDPDMHFLDIGSHIGEYSLMAGKLGRQAIAVDPIFENVIRLCASIQHNKFSTRVKVVYAALSDVKTTVSFNPIKGNVGATTIKKGQPVQSTRTGADKYHVILLKSKPEFDPNTIQTVLLDELLPFVTFKKAFMKMDVETHESSVLKGGENFFYSLNIPYILMEWSRTTPETGQQIIEFMKRHGYIPQVPDVNDKPLKFENSRNWPENVLWVKL